MCVNLHNYAHADSKQGSPMLKEGKCYDIYDPNEQSNRKAFNTNVALYENLIRPPLVFYNTVMPSVLKQRIDSFFDNLQLPLTLVNNILQGNSSEASKTIGRFITNSTIGILGLFDVASGFGIDHKKQGFANTLGYYGSPYGEFSVSVFFGPSTTRGRIGGILDFFFDPINMIIGYNNGIFLPPYYLVSNVSDKLQQHTDLIHTFGLEGVDPYVRFRSTYLQYVAKYDLSCENINQIDYNDE